MDAAGRDGETFVDQRVRERRSIRQLEWIIAPAWPHEETVRMDGIHVVILARNEEGVLGGTLRALNMCLGPQDTMHVVADHCCDKTAAIAQECGAVVHARMDGGPAGKGHALQWWLNATDAFAHEDDMIVVLDADSIVAPNFFSSVRSRLQAGQDVVQTRVEPVVRSLSPIAKLAAYSESTEQHVNDALRSRLGWSVRLRGTGMGFRRHVLKRICSSLTTLVEDVEMTVQLGAEGTRIHFAYETFVADPKPDDQAGAVRQRARWMTGQLQVVKSYFWQILRLLARGPSGWSLLSAVLLKPKTLLIPLKALLSVLFTLAAVLWGGWFFTSVASLGAFAVVCDIGAYVYGLRYARDRREALQTLALAPIYLVMWMRSLALSAVSGNRWHRVRPMAPAKPMQETGLMAQLAQLERRLQLRNQASIPTALADGGD